MNVLEQGSEAPAEPAPGAERQASRRVVRDRRLALGAGLFALVYALFVRAVGFEFVLWDDDLYVTAHPIVQGGLSWKGVVWAFTSEQASNWHPLTGLSHMLDVELFGGWAGGHHLTSVALHAASTALLFFVLSALTGRDLASAFAAALFGVHPLHVESVAWIAERKDVLSTFFGFAAIGVWAAWTRRGGAWRYGLALGLFVLGLLAKPMLVTLPFVLLLLCAWPLDRARERGWKRCALELWPWFAASAASSIVTLVVQRGAGAMESSDVVAFPLRCANALVALASYLAQTVWPAELAVLYPHPYLVGGTPLAAGTIVLAGLVLAALSIGVRALRRGYLTVGWLWFLGTLVPVLGLVQVGSQAMADRYTYLPLVGVFVAVAFGAEELVARGRVPRALATGLAFAVVGACCVRSWTQLGAWRDSRTLFERTLDVEPRSPILLHNLGNVLFEEGLLEEAERRFREGLEVAPGSAELRQGLAVTLRESGEREAALRELETILAANPEHEQALFEYGWTLQGLERLDEALAAYTRLFELDPEHARARYGAGLIALDAGDVPRAVRELRAAVRLDPGWIEARNNLGWLLASSADPSVRAPEEAVELAQETLARAGRYAYPALFDTLGVALAAAGRFDAAIAACDEGIELIVAGHGHLSELGNAMRIRRALYAEGKPFVSSVR